MATIKSFHAFNQSLNESAAKMQQHVQQALQLIRDATILHYGPAVDVNQEMGTFTIILRDVNDAIEVKDLLDQAEIDCAVQATNVIVRSVRVFD